jgi:hypothetical protein
MAKFPTNSFVSRSASALGALMVILSLFVDPFFQQIVTIGELQRISTENLTSVPRAVHYSKGVEFPISAGMFA